MKLSIIIPTVNEADKIYELVKYLFQNEKAPDFAGDGSRQSRDFAHAQHACTLQEIIVVDGSSDDNTAELAEKAGASVYISEQRCRAKQMNIGADLAGGDIFYFVHADTYPPKSFINDIVRATEAGYQSGCFRLKFDSNSLPFKMHSYLSRFKGIMFRGGDETLFVTRSAFEKVGGFNTDQVMMEDYDMVLKLQKISKFKIIPKNALVSDRKAALNGYFRTNASNVLIFLMFFLGFSQDTLVNTYNTLVKNTKYFPNTKY